MLLLIGNAFMTMISLSLNNRTLNLMIVDYLILRIYKTDIIWNLDDLTVVSFFFFQKSGTISNGTERQKIKFLFVLFEWNEQIIDNITQ